MYGFEEEVVSGNSGGKFGLNQKAFMTKFQLETYGDNKECFDVNYILNGKEFRTRYFPVERLWKDGAELTKDTPEYKEEYVKATKMLSATLISILKCFVSEDKIKDAFKTPVNSFIEYANVLVKVLDYNPMWNVEEIDLFLEWENKLKEGQEKSWLQIPRDTKQGSFITKSVEGNFTEIKSDAGIIYKDEKGNVHPFKRNDWYAKSSYANRTDNSTKTQKVETTKEETPTW